MTALSTSDPRAVRLGYEPRDHGARCDLCPCNKDREFVPPEAPASGKIRLVIVGEGPGRTEVALGQPFMGRSGMLLNDLLAEADGKGVRKDAFVTNAALCSAYTDADKDDAAACCAPRLYRELQAIDKSIPILALGKPAARSLLGVKNILRTRGFVWRARPVSDSSLKTAKKAIEKASDKREKEILGLQLEALQGRAKLEGRLVLPSIHPAFVLRSECWYPILAADIDRAVRWLKQGGLPLADQDGKYRVVEKPTDVKKALAKLKKTIAFDIETDGVDPLAAKIRCVGFSDGESTVVIHPWKKSKHAKLMTAALKNRQSGGHNVLHFDTIALERDGVKFDFSKIWDSLIAHHSYASHLPQSLSQVVSFYDDAGPWKFTARHGGADGKELPPDKLPVGDLLLYNSQDCKLNVRSWTSLQGDLEPELHTYKIDHQTAMLCRGLIKTGIAVDVERKEMLSKALRRRAGRMLVRMRRLVGKKSFHSHKTADIRHALFVQFKAPALVPTPTGLPSTSAAVLQGLSQQHTRAGKLSRLILKYRGAAKIRSTYIDSVEIDSKRRAHFTWKCFGTVNGRWSCRFMTLPRVSNPKHPALEDRVREIYIPASGRVFVYFDVSQAEMRLAAQLSGDENFMRVCSQKDVHTANALLLFPEAREMILNDPKGVGKMFRDIAKNVGFAVNYMAGEDTLLIRLQAEKLRKPITLKTVRHMLEVIHHEFRVHYKYVEQNVELCKRQGFLRTPISGRIRHFGHNPKPTDCANFPVQSGVADIMNERMIEICSKLPGGSDLVAQIHDAGLFDCVIGKPANQTKKIISDVWAKPVILPESGRSFVLPIELKEGFRFSEVA